VDEPTGKLDTGTAREIFTLFGELVKQDGVTILLAAHDLLVDKYMDGSYSCRMGRSWRSKFSLAFVNARRHRSV
jgi:ABC-type lipoprotein export system ATPase subunit